jgi:RHS repeat-associated protein
VGYLYDAEGQRVAKGTLSQFSCNLNPHTNGYPTNGFTVTHEYLHDASGGQFTEFDGQGLWLHTNVFAEGQIVATYKDDGQGVHFHFTDWLGTRRVQTDYKGDPELQCQGGSFGDALTCLPTTNASDATEIHFTGKERDQESGLDLMGFRYYASTMGRFMSPDHLGGKLEDPQSLNRYAYARNNPLVYTDPTGMNFGLPCSGGNTDTCNNGLQGSWQHDADGNRTKVDAISIGNKDGTLQDVSSNNTGTYIASFDGKNVSLTNSSGTTQNGSWLQGTADVKGISGGGDLSSKFSFTFSDHGGGNQRLNASWAFSGSNEDAVRALEKAGYSISSLDNRFNNELQPPAGGSLIHMRTPGDFPGGADSGHAIIDIYPKVSVPASGEVHVGEHNPTTPLGFILHQAEIH